MADEFQPEPETLAGSAPACARPPKRRSRAPIWIIAAGILLIIIYSIVWYIMAGRVADKLTDFMAQTGQNGVDIHCADLRKSGFPLRLDLSCSGFSVMQKPAAGDNAPAAPDLANIIAQVNDDKAFSYRGGFVSAGAPVYAPHWISLALGAPAHIKLPNMPIIEANWQSLQCEGDFTARHPHNLSLTAEKLSLANLPMIYHGGPVAADFIRFDSHQEPGNQARLTLSFDNLSAPYSEAGAEKQLPQADGALDFSIADGDSFFAVLPRLIQSGDTSLLRGRSGVIRGMTLDFASGGGISFSGPFSVADDGRLNGDISLTVKDSAALLRTMRAAAPAQADNLDKIFFLLNAMPKNARGEPELPLRIHKGRLQIGFLSLGKLPRL